jgi:hypothetical protein
MRDVPRRRAPDGRRLSIADHPRFREYQLVLMARCFDDGFLQSVGMAPSEEVSRSQGSCGLTSVLRTEEDE